MNPKKSNWVAEKIQTRIEAFKEWRTAKTKLVNNILAKPKKKG